MNRIIHIPEDCVHADNACFGPHIGKEGVIDFLIQWTQESDNNVYEKGNVLFIGGGSGRVLKQLILLKPHLQIDYIDASKKMINRSKTMISNHIHHVNFIHGTQNDIPNIKYDAILTFFYLDLFQAEKRKILHEKRK